MASQGKCGSTLEVDSLSAVSITARVRLPRPALLGRIGARIEEDEFVQIPLEGDRLTERQEREEADGPLNR